MTGPAESRIRIAGLDCRIWSKGDGDPPLCFLAGLGGLPRWTELLERLSARRRVCAPSLPGFPGGLGHAGLDSVLDWVAATLDLLEGAGFEGGDLMGVSVGGALAAEVAALRPDAVRRLVLVSPFGLFDPDHPGRDPFAETPSALAGLMCRDPARWQAHVAAPEGADPVEWSIEQARAAEAAARLLWPLGDTGLERRLHRVRCPTLLLRGEADAVIPEDLLKRFASGIGGPTESATIANAGHLADLDAPEAVAERTLAFLL